jgi:CheY-like chemotaxis protein
VARILVADNDQSALDLATLDLRLEGHTVVAATDGESVLALVEKEAPDVVVLDYRMPPGPTGLVVGKKLRAQYPALRIVLYTNYPDADLVRDALASGLLFLPKGDLRRLRAAVST